MRILEPVDHILIGTSVDVLDKLLMVITSTLDTSDQVDYAVGDIIYNGAGVVFSGIHEYT